MIEALLTWWLITSSLPPLPTAPTHAALIVPAELSWAWEVVKRDNPEAAYSVYDLRVARHATYGGWVPHSNPHTIYIEFDTLNTDWSTLYVLRHELQHVEQFVLRGEKPNDSQHSMRQIEADKSASMMIDSFYPDPTQQLQLFTSKGMK